MLMKRKYFVYIFLLCLLGGMLKMSSQEQLWTSKSETSTLLFKKKTRKEVPVQNKIFQLNKILLLQKLGTLSANKKQKNKTTIPFPDSYGKTSNYSVTETPTLSPVLQEKFPNIRSYTGVSQENPHTKIRFSTSKAGLHLIKFQENNEIEFIDPYTQNGDYYTVYSKKSIPKRLKNWTCNFDEKAQHHKSSKKANTTTVATLKTFRMALSCTLEYAQFHIEDQNIDATADILTKKEAVLSAMNITLTRVNGIFEKDLAITMQLVDNNEKLIYLDSESNPYSGDVFNQLDQIQAACDNEIGFNKYDIGHLFRVGDAGIAELSGACTGVKAMGITGTNPPIGDSFDVDYVAHEIGHQLGATHTFNNSCNENRTNYSAVEPGSGSTIMAYAGICFPNVQNNSDTYFHSVSISQIQTNTNTGASTCATESLQQQETVIPDAGSDLFIPVNTPFMLKGTATGNLENATYCWEQTDTGIAEMPPNGMSTVGPLFRSVNPSNTNYRYFPKIETIITGETGNAWEQLPQKARILNFNFTVRNNETPISQTKIDALKLNTTENAGPFLVTSQNKEEILYAGENISVTWDVANTDAAPINESLVNISLSLDGGYSYPISLATNVPNDGQQDIVVPLVQSLQARIKVAAAENVFFNINTADLEIITTDFVLSPVLASISSCNKATETFEVNYKTFNNYQGLTSFSIENLPSGLSATISPESANTYTTITINLSGLDEISKGKYNFLLKGVGSSLEHETVLKLENHGLISNSPALTCPKNNAIAQSTSTIFKWSANPNANSYLIEIATDSDFSTIVDSANTPENNYTSKILNEETSYYWRVSASNSCTTTLNSLVATFTTGAAEILEYSSNNLQLEIPDNNNQGISTTIDIPDNFDISNLRVMLNITHSFIGDLEIILTHPDNETIYLTQATGREGQNLLDVLFDDNASKNFLTAIPPFSDAYRPFEPLATFNNLNSKGEWTLTVADKAAEDIGFLNNWNILFDAIPKTEQTCAILPKAFTPNGDSFNDMWRLGNIRVDSDYTTNIYPYVNLKIYSPLGELIYAKEKYDNTFDGHQNNGTKLKTGPYIYHIESNEVDFQTLKGWIYIKY